MVFLCVISNSNHLYIMRKLTPIPYYVHLEISLRLSPLGSVYRLLGLQQHCDIFLCTILK